MHADPRMQQLIDKHPAIQDWLKEHGPSLLETLHVGSADPDVLDYFILPIARLANFINCQFPMYKDDTDRVVSDVLSEFLEGKPVDEKTLRRAMVLLVQRFNAACDRIHILKSELDRRRQPPYHRLPMYR